MRFDIMPSLALLVMSRGSRRTGGMDDQLQLSTTQVKYGTYNEQKLESAPWDRSVFWMILREYV